MASIRNIFKLGLERLSGHRVWLEHSSNEKEILKLLKSLAPVSIEQPLVRIGGQGDGGYLVPEDLADIILAVSPGVSTEVSFDLAMADRGINVLMADASVDGPPVENEHFHFEPKFVDVFEDEGHMRLDALCEPHLVENKGDRILQMDIEGAEYRVLLDASDETLQSFRIMIIEFHQLDHLFSKFPFRIIQATFLKLLRYHHVVHIHPNNVAKPTKRGNIIIPPVMEFTFYRKDRARLISNQKPRFPNKLDRDNVKNKPGLILPQCWR